ncbi:hypothetical protein FBY22_1157 [Streptomyces sp. SLBN-31]|nr:hypothetical protein FBY22_1157 [Streptomyces sp. SLBN-31]
MGPDAQAQQDRTAEPRGPRTAEPRGLGRPRTAKFRVQGRTSLAGADGGS